MAPENGGEGAGVESSLPPTVPAKPDYYGILGVEKDCTDAQLKKAYKKMSLKLHPDKNQDDPDAQVPFPPPFNLASSPCPSQRGGRRGLYSPVLGRQRLIARRKPCPVLADQCEASPGAGAPIPLNITTFRIRPTPAL